MTSYVCYDLKAIQSFIFRVPKLKYIVGGSAIVDRFDREIAPTCGQAIFCAGGKGAFSCENDAEADAVERKLVQAARSWGLDIRLGRHQDYTEAAHCADRLYTYLPDTLDGHPCAASGLYPVPPGAGRGRGRDVHPIIEQRIYSRDEPTFRHFEKRLLAAKPDFGPGLLGRPVSFLSNLEPDDPSGSAGARSLDNLRRWAVVCMDGNDMGRQFRHQATAGRSASLHQGWIRAMSRSLDRCAERAARAGLERVVRLWSRDKGSDAAIDACCVDGEVVLPVRPLVVGGDDIVVLCHPRYAFEFVTAAAKAWEESSESEARAYTAEPLWPATGNRLSISAGVLFCPVNLPLHTAITYAESLLASAKGRGRSVGGSSSKPASSQAPAPAPACVDWESVTESMLDHPAARRQRELRFRDGDVNRTVELTRRPYTLAEFGDLLEKTDPRHDVAALPRTTRHGVLEALRRGKFDRDLFRLRVGKRRPELATLLDEDGGPGSAWTIDGTTQRTWLPDAISILEETARQEAR